jgi:hypothetical protein
LRAFFQETLPALELAGPQQLTSRRRHRLESAARKSAQVAADFLAPNPVSEFIACGLIFVTISFTGAAVADCPAFALGRRARLLRLPVRSVNLE